MHPPPIEIDPHLRARLAWADKAARIAVVAIAGGVLVLWLVPPLAAFAPVGWSRMRALTAIGLLGTIAGLTLAIPGRPRPATLAATAIALLLAAGAVAILATYAGILPIDPWLSSQRPSPQTTAGLLLAAACLLLIRRGDGPLGIVADAAAIAISTYVLFLAGSYALNLTSFFGISPTNFTSPQTLLCIALIAFVISGRRAVQGGALSILVGDGLGSRIARRVLPGVVILPFFVFDVISRLNDLGISSTIDSQAIAAPIVALITFAVMAWMGHYTNDMERQLRQQSLTDQLTGVLNRRGFEDASARLARRATHTRDGALVFYFDLDNLKQANDILGHTAGSQVIQCFADLLSVSFRSSDVIGRVGGDEFIVLTPAPVESAEEILTRFARVVAELNAAGQTPMPISYSVGYAELPPGAVGDLESLVAEADARMYAEKSRKRAA